MAATASLDRAAVDVLAADLCAAWAEYLESTGHQFTDRYEDIEPWAWARLQRRLKVIAARRKALK